MTETTELAEGAPVEWAGEEFEQDGVLLRHGHPGRVDQPGPEDVFVSWVGLEGAGVSRWLAYDSECIKPISEAEFAQRVQRM